MIRDCGGEDFATILAIINEAAKAYKGVIPLDRWHEPYMPEDELATEITAGVQFRGATEDRVGAEENLVGVIGLQEMSANPGCEGPPVSLIRHAYVQTLFQRQGVGSALLEDIIVSATRPLLVGTWAAAHWAVDFYKAHGFRQIKMHEKDRLLATYWNIPARQIQTSVVLAGPGFK